MHVGVTGRENHPCRTDRLNESDRTGVICAVVRSDKYVGVNCYDLRMLNHEFLSGD